MEKQLEWAHKMGGMESQGISRAGQTVLTRLMESQIWHPPASSVTLWERAQKRDSVAFAHFSVWLKVVSQLSP